MAWAGVRGRGWTRQWVDRIHGLAVKAWAATLLGATAATGAAQIDTLAGATHVLDHLADGLSGLGWGAAALVLGTWGWRVRRLLGRRAWARRAASSLRAAVAGAAVAAALAWQLALSW